MTAAIVGSFDERASKRAACQFYSTLVIWAGCRVKLQGSNDFVSVASSVMAVKNIKLVIKCKVVAVCRTLDVRPKLASGQQHTDARVIKPIIIIPTVLQPNALQCFRACAVGANRVRGQSAYPCSSRNVAICRVRRRRHPAD